MLHSDKKLYHTHMGTFPYDFNLILDVTYCQNFAFLGTSTSYMVNITFPLVDLTELTELTHQLLDTFLLAVDPPLKNPVIYYFAQKSKTLHTSCLTMGNNNDI